MERVQGTDELSAGVMGSHKTHFAMANQGGTRGKVAAAHCDPTLAITVARECTTYRHRSI